MTGFPAAARPEQVRECSDGNGRVACPFTNLRLEAAKPLPEGYPAKSKTVGDHVRARRLGLGLIQAEAAIRMGVSEAAVYEWEKRTRAPSIRQWPRVIAFLGYDPHPEPVTTAEALRALRRRRGWSQRELAAQLGVDPVTVWEWERGREPHNRRCRERLSDLFQSNALDPLIGASFGVLARERREV